MLEFFAVFWLCRANKKIATDKGRRPGGFIALTIVLWIVFETIGIIAGYIITGGDRYPSMFIGLMCAGLGGLIAFLITKLFPQGDYVEPVAKPTYNNYGAPDYTNPNSSQVPSNQPAYMYNPNMYQPAPQQPASVPAIRYCRNCGSQNHSTNRFCEFCGESLE